MRTAALIICCLLLATALSAQQSTVGAAGAQFLKIGVGSKYQAMGEASVAVADDIYSMYWNPAGLAAIENGQISFTNVNYVLDIDLNWVGYAKNFENVGVFGVSATVLSMGEQEITNIDNQDGTGQSYSASSYALGVSFARQLTAKFAFGATIKYVSEKIHLEKADGVAIDMGTMLNTGYRNLRLGMSITNMGADMKFDGPDLSVPSSSPETKYDVASYNLPLTFRVGLAYDVDFGPKSLLTVSGELKHPNDNDQKGSLGLQYGFDQKFFLRGGYKINYDEETLALGGGLSTTVSGQTRLVIDYSWQDFGRLETTQRFSVGFTF